MDRGSMSTEDKYPNWFAVTAQANFEQHLLPLAGTTNVRYLQLGVYTGDASVWLCENVLTAEWNFLYDVDTWKGSKELAHESINFDEVYEIYQAKTEKYKQIRTFRQNTVDYLIDGGADQPFNFIYIDADHTTVGVLLDAELSWPLLKSGGIMAFDDYTWGTNLPMHQRPKPGIDLFLLRHSVEYEVLAVNSQYWIKKK